MRFDPAVRLEKYSAVSAALKRDGFTAVVPTKSMTVDCVHISRPERPGFQMIVTSRKQGWQIHLPRRGEIMRAVYDLPNDDVVLNLIRSLWESDQPLTDQPSTAIQLKFGIREVPYAQWSQDGRNEDAERWNDFGWQELSEEEVQEIESRYSPFFFPDGEYGDLRLPDPFESWQINEIYGLADEQREEIEGAISMRTLRSLQACTVDEEELLVLDWQHTCYRWNVHKGIRRPFRDEWAKPIFVSGDDVAFLAPDFRFGLFSLRGGGFHVFGDGFLDTFRRNCPLATILKESV